MEKDKLEEAVCSPVAYFNDGTSAIVKLCDCVSDLVLMKANIR